MALRALSSRNRTGTAFTQALTRAVLLTHVLLSTATAGFSVALDRCPLSAVRMMGDAGSSLPGWVTFTLLMF